MARLSLVRYARTLVGGVLYSQVPASVASELFALFEPELCPGCDENNEKRAQTNHDFVCSTSSEMRS